jgi:hypothetical protein
MVRLFTAHTNQGQASPLAGVADAFKAEEDAKRMDEALRLQGEKFKQDKAVAALSFDLEERKLEQRRNDSEARIAQAAAALTSSEAMTALSIKSAEDINASRIKSAEGEGQQGRDAAQLRQETVALTAQERLNKKEEDEAVMVASSVKAATDQATALDNEWRALTEDMQPGADVLLEISKPLTESILDLKGATGANVAVLLKNFTTQMATARRALGKASELHNAEFLTSGIETLTEELSGPAGAALRIPAGAAKRLNSGSTDPRDMEETLRRLKEMKHDYEVNSGLFDVLSGIEMNTTNPLNKNFRELVKLGKAQVSLDEDDPNWSTSAALLDDHLLKWGDTSKVKVDQRNRHGQAIIDLLEAGSSGQGLINEQGVYRRRAVQDNKVLQGASKAQADINRGSNQSAQGYTEFNPVGRISQSLLKFVAVTGTGEDQALAASVHAAILTAGDVREQLGTSADMKEVAMNLAGMAASEFPGGMERLGGLLKAAMVSPEYIEFQKEIDKGAADNRMDAAELARSTDLADEESEKNAKARGNAPGSQPR